MRGTASVGVANRVAERIPTPKIKFRNVINLRVAVQSHRAVSRLFKTVNFTAPRRIILKNTHAHGNVDEGRRLVIFSNWRQSRSQIADNFDADNCRVAAISVANFVNQRIHATAKNAVRLVSQSIVGVERSVAVLRIFCNSERVRAPHRVVFNHVYHHQFPFFNRSRVENSHGQFGYVGVAGDGNYYLCCVASARRKNGVSQCVVVTAERNIGRINDVI